MLEVMASSGLTEVELLLENVGGSHLADEGRCRDLRGPRGTDLGVSDL